MGPCRISIAQTFKPQSISLVTLVMLCKYSWFGSGWSGLHPSIDYNIGTHGCPWDRSIEKGGHF